MKNKFMAKALIEAKKAYEKGEVPVGAVVVHDGKIIGRGHNRMESTKNPTAHAEMIALKKAAQKFGFLRLINCEMYVTIEPCIMCTGAIVLARIKTLYIGANDLKTGACGSAFDIINSNKLNHKVEIHSHIMEKECSELMTSFFTELRENKRGAENV